MVTAANLGFPRIGAHRELKKAVESYWKGGLDAAGLEAEAKALRARHWQAQVDLGIHVIPSGDFAFYDQMLDTALMAGAIPSRFGWRKGEPAGLDLAFNMARSMGDVPAMEMTKWFDTNYHYIVPEFSADTDFALTDTKVLDHYAEAKALGIETRPVLIGPVTFLLLGKMKDTGASPLTLLDRLLPVYAELLRRLKETGAEWVQIDEPMLVTDLDADAHVAYRTAYAALAEAGPKLMLTTYFGGLGDNAGLAASLPVHGLHLDLVRGTETAIPKDLPADRTLSLGIVDGRNIWRADLGRALAQLEAIRDAHPENDLQVAPSCSLLHVPVDIALETKLDRDLKSWLAFAHQKLDEVALLARGLAEGRPAIAAAIRAAEDALNARRAHPALRDATVKARLAGVDESWTQRKSPFADRRRAQADLGLPLLPTTTIGSFPQTEAVRKARAAFRRGDITSADYDVFLEAETAATVRRQEKLGLDVLVHGEFERTDMVEYFGEKLAGFAFTQNGWVQSYGTRCVKPPVIYGDVSRPHPMTVRWAAYAQSLTEKPVKGMLTGPVTILQWSFVRNDQPRAETCRQIALAIRDEVQDLEANGIRVIQIDEPALREGLPLRQAEQAAYLDWATAAFRLSASGVSDETQIHTHMCYAEFNDIMPAIASLDADVISIETSRSDMELLSAFGDFSYPNGIGPGVWDIHSPRVPGETEMIRLLAKAAEVIEPSQLWVNPDCGLKTRGWPEVEASIGHMVQAAQAMRQKLAAG